MESYEDVLAKSLHRGTSSTEVEAIRKAFNSLMAFMGKEGLDFKDFSHINHSILKDEGHYFCTILALPLHKPVPEEGELDPLRHTWRGMTDQD